MLAKELHDTKHTMRTLAITVMLLGFFCVYMQLGQDQRDVMDNSRKRKRNLYQGAIDSPKRAGTICATARADALMEVAVQLRNG